jgi:capsular exopolysaccharide synthesis family protein
MRRTRIAVDEAITTSSGAGGKIVMVTSAVLGEGKTTTALALARSYALSGRKTLLIDCDLRQPMIAGELDIQPPVGLLDLLATHPSRFDLRLGIAQESDTGLSLVLGSQGTDRPTDTLLASTQFARLLADAAEMYEIVLLDTPPVEPVVDALYIAPHVDSIVLVSRWASTSQREVKQTLASLHQAKRPSAQILSMLNGTNQAKPGRRQVHNRFYDADQAWQFARPTPEHTASKPRSALGAPHSPVANATQHLNVVGFRHRIGESEK